MSKSPFLDFSTYALPLAETLEVKKHRRQLEIGIPKETCLEEKRIALSPEAVGLLVNEGHTVLIETGAGEGARYSDRDYSEVGAQLVYSAEAVFKAPILLKVEPPSEEEINWMQPRQLLISALQLKMRQKSYFEKLMTKKVTAISYEGLHDEDGLAPIVRSMSEIAGSTAVLVAAEYLSNTREGLGYLLGGVAGVPPTEVVIVGAGTVGTFAARTALGLGARVKVFDRSLSRLRRLQEALHAPLSTCILQPHLLAKALKHCEVAIGALRSESGRTPCVVSAGMVENMKNGAVVVDVSIDQGGVFETSEPTNHSKPIITRHGVIHYCVPNIPSRVSRTASFSLSNVLGPLLIEMGDLGGVDGVLQHKLGIRNGLYLYNGILTSRALGDYFELPYTESDLFF